MSRADPGRLVGSAGRGYSTTPGRRLAPTWLSRNRCREQRLELCRVCVPVAPECRGTSLQIVPRDAQIRAPEPRGSGGASPTLPKSCTTNLLCKTVGGADLRNCEITAIDSR